MYCDRSQISQGSITLPAGFKTKSNDTCVYMKVPDVSILLGIEDNLLGFMVS